MRRFALRIAPVALMVVPLWIYRSHFSGLDRSFDWRQHTYEARSLAERVARDAGTSQAIDRLRADIDAFAGQTADNPHQVAVVEAMRSRLDPPDPVAIGRLADLAIDEENRLLPSRTANAEAILAEIRRLADWVCGLGIAIMVASELVDMITRRRVATGRATERADSASAVDRAMASQSAAEDDLEAQGIEWANMVGELKLKLEIYEARYGRDLAHREMAEMILLVAARVPAVEPPAGSGPGRGDDG